MIRPIGTNGLSKAAAFGSQGALVSLSRATRTYTPATTMGAAISAEDRARIPVVRDPAKPAATSRVSLNNPAAIHPRSSSRDDVYSAAAVPTPTARSRIPTVRRSNGIDVAPATGGSQRKNFPGAAPKATPAPNLTAAIPAAIALARFVIRPTIRPHNPPPSARSASLSSWSPWLSPKQEQRPPSARVGTGPRLHRSLALQLNIPFVSVAKIFLLLRNTTPGPMPRGGSASPMGISGVILHQRARQGDYGR